MIDSFANVFWIRAGERSGPVRNVCRTVWFVELRRRDDVATAPSSSRRRCSAAWLGVSVVDCV